MADITSNLTVHLPFTGDSLVDAASGLTFTNVNSATFTNGRIGRAVDFEASSTQYLEHANNAAFQGGNNNFTIAAWIWLESLPSPNGASYQIFSKDSNVASSRDYAFEVYNNAGTRCVQFHFNGGTGLISSAAVTTGTWYHAAAAHDAANDVTRLWLNGVAITPVATGGTAPNDSSAAVRVGARVYSGFVNPFDGIIDDVRFYKRVLSTDDVRMLYHLPSKAARVAHYNRLRRVA